jgi:hypothetical protein
VKEVQLHCVKLVVRAVAVNHGHVPQGSMPTMLDWLIVYHVQREGIKTNLVKPHAKNVKLGINAHGDRPFNSIVLKILHVSLMH